MLVAIVLLGVSVFLMCFNIIFRNKPFPDGEISRNKELRKRGIVCASEEEMRLYGRKGKKSAAKCSPENCAECGAICGDIKE